MAGILVSFHTTANTGYAIAPQEKLFYQVALEITGSSNLVHYAYSDFLSGEPKAVFKQCKNLTTLDFTDNSKSAISEICNYIEKNNITTLLGYDTPVKSPYYKQMRKSGIKNIISHWGAPLSSINTGIKLWLKRLEMKLYKHGPDLFILQSEGMRKTATNGRGIEANRTTVIKTGIDTIKNSPFIEKTTDVYNEFNIPKDRKIVFYSGHFEARKGVDIIVSSAIELVEKRKQDNWHFLLFGNQNGEEASLKKMLENSPAKNHVTFGGYYENLETIRSQCFVGTVATTGWDSFPRSTLEIQASGLPLIVSDLLGLRETVADGISGYTFPVGDYKALADIYMSLDKNPAKYRELSENARKRAVEEFSQSRQKLELIQQIKEISINNGLTDY